MSLFVFFYLHFSFSIDTEQPLSVSFLRYRPGIRLAIPVLFINQDDNIDIRRGAHIHVINRFKVDFIASHWYAVL